MIVMDALFLVVFCPMAASPLGGAAGGNSGGISLEEDRLIRPGPPSNPKIEISANGIMVFWNPVGLEIITSYKVLRKRDGNELSRIAVIRADPENELSGRRRYCFEDRDTRKKGTYAYALVTIDHYGNESDLSEQAEIKFAPESAGLRGKPRSARLSSCREGQEARHPRESRRRPSR